MTNSGKPQVVFFGSGPVSARSLELLQHNFAIEAVITKPTTLQEMTTAANDVPIHTVANKAELDLLIDTNAFDSKVAVLIDFGIIVSQKVIDSFPLGIVNSHFSLLPQLRGADPISFAILEGLNKTGVSLMLLVEAMDEGPVISCGIHELNGAETTPTLTERLILLSNALLNDNLPKYISGDAKATDQTKLPQLIPGHPDQPSYSRKLTKQDGLLDFRKPAAQLEREVRAFIEWPKSRTKLASKDVIITQAYAIPSIGADQKPGDTTVVKETGQIGIATSGGTFWIEKLKPAGKKEMTAAAFLAGYGHLF
jgi:methionyl-tRNA formyltransferase